MKLFVTEFLDTQVSLAPKTPVSLAVVSVPETS